MTDKLSLRLVLDELWELVEPLLPAFTPRRQGGGTAPTDERAVFTAVVYVLTSGRVWWMLPPSFGVTVPTAHRRFTAWTEAGLWRRLQCAVLDELGSEGLLDWSRVVVDGASVRAKRGPDDRAESSSIGASRARNCTYVLSDRTGIPLTVAVSAANTPDAAALRPLVRAIPAIRSRRGPRRRKPGKLHADKAYDHRELRDWVRDRGIGVRIARKGIESSQHLGRHRWVIERTIAWLGGYHRLSIRYDRKDTHYCGFLTLAATLTCYKKLAKDRSAT